MKPDDITDKSIEEHMRFRDEEIQKTPQPTSVRLGDQTLSKFYMQRTGKRSVWYCRANPPETLPDNLPADSSRSVPCILKFSEHILEAEAHSFSLIQSLPPVAKFLIFSIQHKELPKTAQ
jgi:hypothetical protein